MKHGLIIYGQLNKEKDWELLKKRVNQWKSLKLSNKDSFFTTVSMAFKRNMLDSKFIEKIDSEIEGTFHTSLSSLHNDKFLTKDIQQCISKGLQSCEEAGLMYTAVCDYNILVDDLDKVFKNKNLCCLGTSENTIQDKILSPKFMFGKTKTLRTIWEDLSCANVQDVESGTFKAFANVAGQKLELMDILDRNSMRIVGRVEFQ